MTDYFSADDPKGNSVNNMLDGISTFLLKVYEVLYSVNTSIS